MMSTQPARRTDLWVRISRALLNRGARALRGARSTLYRAVQVIQLGHVQRDERSVCWCGAAVDALAAYPSFGRCRACGTLVNRVPPTPAMLDRIYRLGSYWRTRQRMRGVPAIEKRGELYRRDGRLQYWLDLVARYAPPAGRAIEVGCAPGVLLEALARKGWSCLGVEPADAVARWVSEHSAIEVRVGFFPGVGLPACDLFLAMDVLEHAPDPQAFVAEIARVLVPGGVAIIQTAIDRHEFATPFGERSDLFDDIEHMFLFTDNALDRLATGAGMKVVSGSERVFVGGEICVMRKP